MNHPVLARLKMPEFKAFPLLSSGVAQTIAASFWLQMPNVRPDASEIIELPDGDRLVFVENKPPQWTPKDRIILLVHGLAGSDQSKYMIRMSRKLTEKGYLVVRLNLRGCGPGFGLARQPYHSGRSEDVRPVLKRLATRYPTAPVTIAGFSLGANIALKLAGEDGRSPTGKLDSVIAVSPPIHLAASAQKLCHPNARIFSGFFMKKIIEQVELTRVKYPDLPEVRATRGMTVTDFDNLYTAPVSGFKNAADYYEQASAKLHVASIRIPTLILSAADDPVVDVQSVRELPPIPGVDVVVTPGGGHVAFLGMDLKHGTKIRYMDQLVTRWIQAQT